jgi:uncharacterized protein (DUF433 family)
VTTGRPTRACSRRRSAPRLKPNRCAHADGVDAGDARAYPWGMDYQRLITIEPGKRGGKPCVRGLRITVTDVLEYLASGMSVEEIVADFPDLTVEDVRACLAFAADRERRLWVAPSA